MDNVNAVNLQWWIRENNMEISLDYTYYKLSCSKCDRKILVQVILAGIAPNTNISVVCAGCLEISKEYRKERPLATQDIEAWMEGDDSRLTERFETMSLKCGKCKYPAWECKCKEAG